MLTMIPALTTIPNDMSTEQGQTTEKNRVNDIDVSVNKACFYPATSRNRKTTESKQDRGCNRILAPGISLSVVQRLP